MSAWLSQFLRSFKPDEAQPLQVRLYRLVCATTAVLCLGVICPVNLLQNLPPGVHVGNFILGLTAAWCYRTSLRGRHHFIGFFVVLVLLLNPIWFLNAGSTGSVGYYFFPSLLYPLAIFRGRVRWILSVFLVLDLCGLLVADYYFPALSVPFQVPTDRVIDLLAGAACSMLGLGVLVWLIVSAHEREQLRISRYAQELAASESNYRAIFNSTSEALFIFGEDGRLIDVNARVCEMFGCDRATALARSIDSRSLGVSPYSRVEAEAKMRRAVEEGPQVFRWRSRRVNGELFWSEVAMQTAEIAGQRRLIAAMRDISSRVQAEEALRTQEERLRLALAASDQGWFDLNIVTGEGTASEEYARIIGLEPVEFKVTATGWLENIHQEDHALVMQKFQACVVHGGTHLMEYRRRTKTGEWKWIRSTGKIVERDAAGRAVRMTGTHADITERKKLEAQLLHSQRLESVGTLAGGVAHDLNNVLTPLMMVCSVLREKLADPADRALMTQMEIGAKRGAAIVRQLLTFSRDLPPARSAVDLARQIEEMRDIMRGTFPREIKLVVRLSEKLWPVTADPIQLHQVLMNLCINARDAMPAGGTLVLEAENIPLPAGELPVEADGRDGRSVKITVSDTGLGIPPENIGRIFDPFFTTKGVGKGTGLGLSTVHGIVKSHGGSITVASEPRGGTSFQVLWPASATAPAPAIPAIEVPRRGPARPVVLVIDDEPFVLAMTKRLLEQDGCEVVAVGGGADALTRIGELAGTVQLVFTDMMMPDMDGLTLVPLLRQVCPRLKVIGASGLDFESRKTELTALGFVEMLRKPYDAATLVSAVRRHLADLDSKISSEPRNQ